MPPQMPMTADVIAAARAEQRTLLSELETKQLIAGGGVNVTETRFATSADEAASHAAELGFPVVLEVVGLRAEGRSWWLWYDPSGEPTETVHFSRVPRDLSLSVDLISPPLEDGQESRS